MTTVGRLRNIVRLIVCCLGLHAVMAVLPGPTCLAADAADPPKASKPTVAPGQGFTYLGKIAPRHARDIKASNWSVGAETMGRDYTIYKNWRKYLGPLGVKKARIQSGWAKTEKQKGKYDWAWLDEIILDMVDQGVEPWVCVCYGNLIYPGGGGTGLSGGLPSSPEALAAWDAYVAALVNRYKKHVDEWELWNEPRTGRGKGAVQYAQFAARTAQVVRRCQPEARLIFAAGGSFDAVFTQQMLTWLRDEGKLSLVSEIAYHPYAYNPDDSYRRVDELRKILRSFSGEITLRQGENGAPSRNGTFGALSKYDWNEQRQAKWATRRLLGDLGRDIPTSYFSICDMAYRVRPGGKDSDWRDDQDKLEQRINYKGLLEINPDKTINHAKQSYRAVQHITALFDSTVRRIPDSRATLSGGMEKAKYSIFGYRSANGSPLVTVWRSSDPPGKRPDLEHVVLTVLGERFSDPVWIDLMTGGVYDVDNSLWKQEADTCTFRRLPVYDSVVVLADRSVIADRLASGSQAFPVDGLTRLSPTR
ncbi:MAG: hypothetical protein JXQ73_30765 [Phycisphaerae bacterium]|nr:hypothetical protein [Phycisphaerae bacterium]